MSQVLWFEELAGRSFQVEFASDHSRLGVLEPTLGRSKGKSTSSIALDHSFCPVFLGPNRVLHLKKTRLKACMLCKVSRCEHAEAEGYFFMLLKKGPKNKYDFDAARILRILFRLCNVDA